MINLSKKTHDTTTENIVDTLCGEWKLILTLYGDDNTPAVIIIEILQLTHS